MNEENQLNKQVQNEKPMKKNDMRSLISDLMHQSENQMNKCMDTINKQTDSQNKHLQLKDERFEHYVKNLHNKHSNSLENHIEYLKKEREKDDLRNREIQKTMQTFRINELKNLNNNNNHKRITKDNDDDWRQFLSYSPSVLLAIFKERNNKDAIFNEANNSLELLHDFIIIIFFAQFYE